MIAGAENARRRSLQAAGEASFPAHFQSLRGALFTGTISGTTTNKEEEEGLEIVGPFSPSVTKQVKKFKSKMKKVSWAPLPRVEHGRRTKRLTNGWTWGGHFDRPWSYYDTFPDGSKCGLDNPWDGQALKMERVALGAVLRAHRMAEDVATGGTKEWAWTRRIQWRLDVKQRPFRSHRDWCPDADPDPHFFGHGRVKIR